jgi:regulator of protease activity HflC (stomatin/prohibitin superfamily)
MADVTRIPLFRHLRGTPTAHVRHVRYGQVVHDGTALSFWYRPLTAVLSEVPVDDRELPLLFHARTVDYQDVTVQASVTYRITDPALAAGRIDFSVDPDDGRWRSTPLEQLGGLLTETAQQHAADHLARIPLSEALNAGVGAVREQVAAGLAADPRLADTGVTVVGVRVVAVRSEPEVERALQTPTREQVQQEADRASFERRALAVEREGAIGANELQNQIDLARREEQLVTQRGTNTRRKAEEAAVASRIDTEAQAAREQRLGRARAEAARAIGEAEAAGEAARIAAYRELSEATLLGLALKEAAGNLPAIGNLVLTPELITPLLARLGSIPSAGETEARP